MEFVILDHCVRRCKDLYEICQANGQLFTSFSSMEEASMDKDQQQINRIYLEYSKLLSTISQVRHKCLDIKGQIISECPYETIVSPKIAMKNFPRFLPWPLRRGQIKNFIKPIMLNNP